MLSGQFWNEDIEALLRPLGEWPSDIKDGHTDYTTIRQLEARAHGLRILKEAQIES
ncbi:MAG: hypothetical protein HZY76_19915 [Anaerolineae bacterium]|nr:MAG: hypothetical protein HZY76_19915 [Anaerolineae bacterium]